MSDDYLWDRSGPPDPEIERLEQTLAPLRYRLDQPGLALGRRAEVRRAPRWRFAAAAAAVVLAAAGVAEFAVPRAPATAWQVAGMELRRGQVLRTGQVGLRLESDAVGRVDLAPGSELLASGAKRLELRRGELTAYIWAPAREFVVDTPSARAVDLGCRYTLSVDERGEGLLRVSMGWVAFDAGGKESFIPAGAQCRTRKKGGPGIPWFEDAPGGFTAALSAYEGGDAGSLGAVLRQARSRDALTLWHLLARTRGEDRAVVFERFAALVRLPAGVTREGILRQDAGMMDLCWNALDLENTGWWRGWERRWSE